jgi:hypothetical protein
VSAYVLDCNLVAPPNAIGQAVLEQRGASHVFMASSLLNDENYVRIASQQNFHPQYLASDYDVPTSSAGAENWDPGWDHAVAISSMHTGELNSGTHNPNVARCNNVLVAHGLTGIRSEQKDFSALNICDSVFFVVQMLNHAGLNPTQLAAVQAVSTMGRFSAGSVPDAVWNKPGRIAGGDFQREITYSATCKCYKVVERTFSPGYP